LAPEWRIAIGTRTRTSGKTNDLQITIVDANEAFKMRTARAASPAGRR
jgi:hypothetical protein